MAVLVVKMMHNMLVSPQHNNTPAASSNISIGISDLLPCGSSDEENDDDGISLDADISPPKTIK